MELFQQKSDCYGCGACQSACPKAAIQMLPDWEGFVYPQINRNLCINCGLCRKVCPIYTDSKASTEAPADVTFPVVYAVRACNSDIRASSSSGGIFPLISNYSLNRNGVVYGAVISKSNTIVHHRADTVEECRNFRGSKYVQSDLNAVFSMVKADLANGCPVVFSGTPCQIAGLKNYLGKADSSGLILCDVVCHGVASPKVWEDYITLLDRKYPDSVSSFQFKDKTGGWHTAATSITYRGRLVTEDLKLQSFQNLYYAGMVSRPSCSRCKFASTVRGSDITLGDFWGIEKIMPDFDDNRGISLVMIHTQKGLDLFHTICGETEYRKCELTDCLQPQLQKPSAASPFRNLFWQDYLRNDFSFAIQYHAGCSLKNFLAQKLRLLLHKP